MKLKLAAVALLLSISPCSAQIAGYRGVALLSGNPPKGEVIHNEFQLKRIIGSEDKPLRVSISDNYALGTAQDSQGSVWMAAVVASMLTGKQLNGCELTVRFSGAGSGPSAGGALCLHFVSALMRKEVPDDVVMTGTVTPDGGIGPVGGVPYKIYAAKKAGYKRVIIPAFSSMEEFKNPATGKVEIVDAVQFGARLGIEVKTVESVGEAYQYLYETPLRRPSPGVVSIAFAPSIASALRGDREALLQTLNTYLASEENTKKLLSALKDLGPEWQKPFEKYFQTSQSAAQASLLSSSHQRAANSIPLFMALTKVLEDKSPATEKDAEMLLKESIEKMRQRAADVALFTGSQKAFSSWPEIQLAPSLDDLVTMNNLPDVLDKAAKGKTGAKLVAVWFAAKYFEHLIDAYGGKAFPFNKTLAAVHNAQSGSHSKLDEEAVSRLLVTLLTAARANAKPAETTGLQRAVEDGQATSFAWAGRGKQYELRLHRIEFLAKQVRSPAQQRIRSCFMATEVLADASADYIVFETIGIIQPPAKKDGDTTPPPTDSNASNRVRNAELGARIVKLARRNAEDEIGRLLKRDPNAVLPIYSFELADSASKAGSSDVNGLLETLRNYYRAYLAANLMNTFLNIEEGNY